MIYYCISFSFLVAGLQMLSWVRKSVRESSNKAIHENTSAERREKLRQALLAYCRLDTEAMVKLVQFFGRNV